MKRGIESYLKNLPLNRLLDCPIGEKFQNAMAIFEILQERIHKLSGKEEYEKSTLVKATTIMTFSILNKLETGKSLSQFTTNDWEDIARNVAGYAVFQDEQKYVQLVFLIYERYIRFSAEQIESFASENTVMDIKSLADELGKKTEYLQMGVINEVEYIESCLWISLEAMIKLIAAVMTMVIDNELNEFNQALAAYAFEYGRFMMYKREQEIINEYIQSQYILNKELEEKYSNFIKELKVQEEYFYTLIDNAFVPDFRERFLNSIVLARETGVVSGDILASIDDVDEFFM